MSFTLEQFFRQCALLERQWRARVQINPKTNKVNLKLDAWHRAHPDRVSVAAWRIDRARRRQTTSGAVASRRATA